MDLEQTLGELQIIKAQLKKLVEIIAEERKTAPRFETDDRGNRFVVWHVTDIWYCVRVEFDGSGDEIYGPYESEQELFIEMDIPAKGRFDE